MMPRFEASYYEGEENERLPEWRVVEWTFTGNGSKIGKTHWKTYDMINGEHEANEIAAVLQHEYNSQFADQYA